VELYQKLEIEFAEWCCLPPEGMVACSSGSSALHLALEALQLPRGSQVIVPEFSMIACPRAVTMAGLVPVFVDCDDRLLMNTNLLPSGDTRTGSSGPLVVLPVHVYGRRFDVSLLHASRICGIVIEDLAEAHGVRPHPETDAACWSMYRNKIIAATGAEGGAVWFRDPYRANRARQLRNQGFTDAHDFTHIPRGVNARLSNTHAELILKSLKDADSNIEKRRQVESWYSKLIPREWQIEFKREVCWVFDVRIPGLTSKQQDLIVKSLNEQGIPARHGFKCCSSQLEYFHPEWESLNAAKMSREVLYLPVDPTLTKDQVEQIVSKFLSAVSNIRGA
jgi:perosamine synthetase